MEDREPSLAERHSIGKLAEILALTKITRQRFVWPSKVLGIPYPSSHGQSPTDAVGRSELFDLLIQGYATPGFARWFGDLLEIVADAQSARSTQLNPMMLPLIKQSTKDACRNRILSGDWGWDVGMRALQILGFEVVVDRNEYGRDAFIVRPLLEGPDRRVYKDRLREALRENHPQAFEALEGAREAFLRGGPDAKRQAIESLRNALINLVKDVTGKELSAGLTELSSDDSRRLRLLKDFRDFVGVEGPHADEQPTERDFFFALRVTEDILTWVLQAPR